MPRSDVFKQQAQVLKALANESRLRIVDRLSRGEASVGQLTDLVGSDISTVSKHLAVLRAHRIVDDRHSVAGGDSRGSDRTHRDPARPSLQPVRT